MYVGMHRYIYLYIYSEPVRAFCRAQLYFVSIVYESKLFPAGQLNRGILMNNFLWLQQQPHVINPSSVFSLTMDSNNQKQHMLNVG